MALTHPCPIAIALALALSLSLFLALALSLSLTENLTLTLTPTLTRSQSLSCSWPWTWRNSIPSFTPPRRETWIQLRRFEDVVQRQFEELRSSLVNRHGSKRDLSANMQPTPSSASLSTGPRT